MSVESVVKSPLVRTPSFYGLLSGILGATAAVTFYYMGKHPFWIFPLFDLRVIFMSIFMFVALREIREYYFSGLLFFWQGMMASMVFILVMALTGYIVIAVFGRLDEGFVTQYIQQGMQQLEQLTPEGIEQLGRAAVDEIRVTLPHTTISWMARRYAVQTISYGLFISIVISIVLRRQPAQE